MAPPCSETKLNITESGRCRCKIACETESFKKGFWVRFLWLFRVQAKARGPVALARVREHCQLSSALLLFFQIPSGCSHHSLSLVPERWKYRPGNPAPVAPSKEQRLRGTLRSSTAAKAPHDRPGPFPDPSPTTHSITSINTSLERAACFSHCSAWPGPVGRVIMLILPSK